MTIDRSNLHYISLKYAGLVALVPIVFNTALIVFGLLDEYYGDEQGGHIKMVAILFFIPVMTVIAIRQFKKNNEGLLRIRQAILVGLEVSIVAICLMIVYHLLFNAYLAPSYHTNYYERHGEEIYAELVACCDYTREQFELHRDLRLSYEKGERYLPDLIAGAFIGFLVSGVAGLIMKKRKRKEDRGNSVKS